MNYIIGMCKKHKDWVSVLADLGYELQLIEQQIRTSSEDTVKPDIVVASNRLLHSVVFECKGGITLDVEQLKRYSSLSSDNLRRWITVFTPESIQFDVCIGDLEENHHFIARMNREFPMITFANDKIFKTGEFKLNQLNAAFKEPISLKGKIAPLSYYSFCEEDKDDYIALFVLRGLVSVAIKNAKGGPSAFEESIITRDDLVKLIFNPVFDALSREHQARLKAKIKDVIRLVMTREEMKGALEAIEEAKGYKISRPLEKFLKEAYQFISFLQTQRPLTEFVKQNPDG